MFLSGIIILGERLRVLWKLNLFVEAGPLAILSSTFLQEFSRTFDNDFGRLVFSWVIL